MLKKVISNKRINHILEKKNIKDEEGGKKKE